MPGNLGHFDHLGVDAAGKRLFVADEDSNSVEVVNLDTGKKVYTITGVERPHSILKQILRRIDRFATGLRFELVEGVCV